MGLVTVYNSFSAADAQLIHSLLDAAGFHAEVFNELASLSLDGYALAAGGIQVRVPEDEVADARALIESADSPDEEDTSAP